MVSKNAIGLTFLPELGISQGRTKFLLFSHWLIFGLGRGNRKGL